MDRLAYQRMLFPNTAGVSSSAPASCPRPKQQGTKNSSTSLCDAHTSVKQEGCLTASADRQWRWVNGLSLEQHLAVGTWLVF